ncbi:DUF6701 domain-containing protein [Paraglaciecola sp. MB-3u-78]|uniref:DUF6701 domain-containing protein n=1 Tax=Paraglaciecola sp. MB-3u-78 TaxID=2058332 RepID=UPI000C335106|nr:DUF6701 domain-containing protein [Paraglaciecola sp. MB-3u-78]PKG99468.1 hypothetical protein CXF95_09535 [Paraglaciecola sp. MB-3u-78]
MTQPKINHFDGILSNTNITFKWLLALVALLPALAGLPSYAATEYSFTPDGTLPDSCELDVLSSTSYTCGVVALGRGDTVVVGVIPSLTPVTVTFTGAFTTAAGNLINTAGATSDLNLITKGTLTLGADTILNANVTGTAAINMGASSSIGGDLSASTTTGVVTLGGKNSVGGFIQTDAGAVNIASLSTVGGGVSTQAGVVTLQTNIQVGGDISTDAGGISIEDGSSTCGSVSTTGGDGEVSIAKNILIGGDVSTFRGAISIGSGSRIGGNVSPLGADVVTLTNVNVGGNVATSAGAITLTNSRVAGTVSSSGGGVVTLTDSTTNDSTLVVPVPPGCAGASELEFIQIEHDGEGLTCESESVTLKACADATCSTLYNDAIEVQLSINGILDQTLTISDGSVIANFSFTNTDTATLSLDQTFECKNGNSTSCDVMFADAGFRFLYGNDETTTIDHQISGNNFTDEIKIQAVKNENGVCTGLFTDNVDVEFSQQNITLTGTTGLSFKVNGPSGTNIAKYPTYTPDITLNFDEDSKAIIPSPVYLDAGQIRLHAKYSVDGVNLLGGSTDFWVSPAKLVVTATSNGSHISGNADSSVIKHKAGQTFDLTVTAYNSLGIEPDNITANYAPNDMQLLLLRTGPTSDGVDGVFNYGNGTMLSSLSKVYQSVTLTTFNSGVSSTDIASYSEVGLLNLDLQDVDYGFSDNIINTDAINIGRFTPDYFEQTVVEHGSLDAVCYQNPPFAYTGQVLNSDAGKGAISYFVNPVVELTAKNVQGVTVQNYTASGYNKLIARANFIIAPTTDSSILGNDSHLLPLTANIFAGTLSNIGLATSDASFDLPLGAGILHYELADEDNFFYPRNENSEVFAQDNDIDFLIDQANFADSDGIKITSPEDITSTASINIRFGRAALKNSFGPETESFRLHLSAQYLNASDRYVVNKQDSCTKYDADNIELTSGTLEKELTGVNVVVGQLEEGKTQKILLTAPGAGKQGTINVEYDIYSWLEYDWNWNGIDARILDQDPSATATFGLFRGNDKINHIREIYH